MRGLLVALYDRADTERPELRQAKPFLGKQRRRPESREVKGKRGGRELLAAAPRWR